MINFAFGFVLGFAAAYFRNQLADAVKALYQKIVKKEPEITGQPKSGGGPGSEQDGPKKP
ncbi:MAG: hypothetical protein ACRCXH_07445 [Shewanella sp.]